MYKQTIPTKNLKNPLEDDQLLGLKRSGAEPLLTSTSTVC